jgi:predicted O-linked N-acetylglucosamine transferase (SPINDLY family)
MRLAPIQCTAWGRPATSGLATIDYHLTADYMEPADGEKHYVEKLFRLPRSGILFEKGVPRLPSFDRAHYGVPETGPLLFMAQAIIKLVPKYDYLFARICERSESEIVFLESQTPGDTKIVKERLERAGVRTRWIPALSHIEYLGLLKLADVSIDSHMWSSANTAIQALTLGTPVVSWPGPFMRSRHSLGFLRQVNAMGLVAKDEDDYIDLVCNRDRRIEAMRDMDANLLYNDYGVLEALDEFLFSHSDI